jgi:hypothetical protein
MSKLFATAAALVALTTAIPISPKGDIPQLARRDDSYTLYTGDGSAGAGWPSQGAWLDFETLFSNNQGLISQSCSQFGQANNSDEETQEVHDAILSLAGSTGVDARFILAVVMQESKGCVRAPTTNWGVRNPGLMQDHNGSGTCNENGVQNPCPSWEVSLLGSPRLNLCRY